MFIYNVILNLLLLSGTLGLNHMGMKKGFTEKNKMMNYSQSRALSKKSL